MCWALNHQNIKEIAQGHISLSSMQINCDKVLRLGGHINMSLSSKIISCIKQQAEGCV
jgi:hypothetical protein